MPLFTSVIKSDDQFNVIVLSPISFPLIILVLFCCWRTPMWSTIAFFASTLTITHHCTQNWSDSLCWHSLNLLKIIRYLMSSNFDDRTPPSEEWPWLSILPTGFFILYKCICKLNFWFLAKCFVKTIIIGQEHGAKPSQTKDYFKAWSSCYQQNMCRWGHSSATKCCQGTNRKLVSFKSLVYIFVLFTIANSIPR